MKQKKLATRYVLDILRSHYCNDNGSVDRMIDAVFKELGVRRVVGPPITNMSPIDFINNIANPELTDDNEHKPLRIRSKGNEWVMVSYYEDNTGHMCLDIEELEQ